MAGALGDLVVALHADTARFESDMGRAARISDREMGKLADTASAAGKAIGFALVAAGTAAATMAAKFVGAAADLDDMAEKTGGSVEELSKLTQQAKLSGTEINAVEGGLVRLAKGLNENDEEAKKVTKALDALGLKAAELRGMDTAKAMQLVAERLGDYADGSAKAALAQDLLGKSGAQLLPYLKDLANNGDLNANVTAKQAAEAEALATAWRRMTLDAENVGKAIALSVAPRLADLIEQFREGTRIAGGFASALRLFGLSSITSSNAPEKIREFSKEIEELQKKRNQFAEQGRTGWFPAIDSQIADLQKKIEFAKLLNRQEVTATMKPGWDEDQPRSGRQLNYESAAKEASKKAVRSTELTAERIAKLQADAEEEFEKSASEAFKFVADMQKKLNDRAYFENIYGEDRLLGMSIEDIKVFHREVLDSAETMMEAGDAAARAYAGFDENGKSLIQTTEKADDLAKSLGMTFSSAFEDAVINGKKFREVLAGIASDVARIILRKQVTEPLANAIGSFDFGKILSGGLGGLFGGNSATVSSGAWNLVGGASGMAIGSDYVPRTGLALVHAGEKIIPAHENASGVTINQVVNVDSRSDQQSVRHAMAVSRQESVAAVQDIQRRRPSR